MSALALQVGTVPVALGPYMITKIFTVCPTACPSAATVGFLMFAARAAVLTPRSRFWTSVLVLLPVYLQPTPTAPE